MQTIKKSSENILIAMALLPECDSEKKKRLAYLYESGLISGLQFQYQIAKNRLVNA